MLRRFTNRMISWKYPLFIFLFLGAILPIIISVMMTSHSVSSRGSIKTINVLVYGEENITTPLISVKWGIIEPGSSENKTIYVKNEGNSPLILSFTTRNWSPSKVSDYIDITWDYNGQTINQGRSIKVVITLMVSEDL